MSVGDVKEVLDMALDKTGVGKVNVRHRPRLLSDNGPCYLSSELKDYLDDLGMEWITLVEHRIIHRHKAR